MSRIGCSLLLRSVDNAEIQLATMMIIPSGSYLLAEYFVFSGAIAAVLTGLLFGNYGSTGGLSIRSVHTLKATWEFPGFVANSLIFLADRHRPRPTRQLAAFWVVITVAFLATLLDRAAAVYRLMPLLRGKWTIPGAYRRVLIWGRLRGAVSLALTHEHVPSTNLDNRIGGSRRCWNSS